MTIYRVYRGVDLRSPRRSGSVALRDAHRLYGDLGLGQRSCINKSDCGVTAQVLHNVPRCRIVGLAPIRAKPVIGGKSDILGCGDDYAGDYPALQTAYPIGQYVRRDPADRGEHLGGHRQHGGSILVGEKRTILHHENASTA